MDALFWRLQLVEDQGICSFKKLATFLTNASMNKISKKEIDQYIDWAKSDKIILDEIEAAQLYTTYAINKVLSNPDSDNLIAHMSPSIRMKAVVDNVALDDLAKDSSLIHIAKLELKKSYDSYMSNQISDIRAKLAFQELIATIAQDEIIPQLIAQTPKYLTCPTIQKWISNQQANLKSSNKKTKQTAKLNLESISKSLIGNTKSQLRTHEYLFVLIQYDAITGVLKKFHSDFVVNNSADKSRINLFCCQKNIRTDDLISRLKTMRGGTGFRQITLDILEHNMELVGSKALANIQEKMSKLQKKHSKFAAKMPEIMHFVDTVNTQPAFLRPLSDYINIVEKIQLNQNPTQ